MTANVEQIHNENKIIDAQIDQGIDKLVDSTAIIKENAKDIGNEVKDQVEMIEDMNDEIDKTNSKINKATSKVKEYEEITAGNYISWIVMIILIIAIIVVLIVFK